MIEVCCGSYKDGLRAYKGGATRIELNSALYLGGLTPSVASLKLLKRETTLTIICMVRPRGAGFTYDETEYKQMLLEAEDLLENGADGLAFGFLKSDHTIDVKRTREFVELTHKYNRTAVFHRAFDCCDDLDHAMTQLVELGIDRVLTSGGQPTAILAGSGVNYNNASSLMEHTGISQVHSSCKDYEEDPTTSGKSVTYSYYTGTHANDYESVDQENVEKLVSSLQNK